MKKIIKSLTQKLGYTIVKTSVSDAQGFTADRLSHIGCPNTVVDVGVAGGTPELYEAFPEAQIVLVEPLPDLHQDTINEIKTNYKNVTLLPFAAGSSASEDEIHIDLEDLGKSSILKRTELTEGVYGTEKRNIKIDRLDALLDDKVFQSPFGVKIDTEGYELNVVKGAEKILPLVDFFIIETSIMKRFEGSYSFAEIIAFMDSVGFEVTDVLSVARQDRIGTRFLDLVFTRRKTDFSPPK